MADYRILGCFNNEIVLIVNVDTILIFSITEEEMELVRMFKLNLRDKCVNDLFSFTFPVASSI
jgi:hypothetical protein